MIDIFISYQHEDRKFAHSVATMLASHGYNVWWDINLLPGQRFADEINTVIKKSKATIVLWTEKSINSEWVKAETTLAMKEGSLIPVWLEKIPLPAPYNTLHTLDLTNWRGESNSPYLEKLLNSVQGILGEKKKKALELNEVEKILLKPAHEAEFWSSISTMKNQSIPEYHAYIDKYGNEGSFTELANIRIDSLKKSKFIVQIYIFTGVSIIGILIALLKIENITEVFVNQHGLHDGNINDTPVPFDKIDAEVNNKPDIANSTIAKAPLSKSPPNTESKVDISPKYCKKTQKGSNVYVATFNGKIDRYKVNSNAKNLCRLSPNSFNITKSGQPSLALDPSKRFIIVGNRGQSGLSLLKIDTDSGVINHAPNSPYTISTPLGVAIDPLGEYVVISGGARNKETIQVRRIEPDFTLSLISNSVFGANAVEPTDIKFTSNGKFIFIAYRDDGKTTKAGIFAYSFNRKKGTITLLRDSPYSSAGKAPMFLAIHPTKNFLYVANLNSESISGYSINPETGVLKELIGSPFSTGKGPNGITISPNGKFLYTSNGWSNNIFGYIIDQKKGVLTPLETSPYGNGIISSLSDVSIDSTGSYLFSNQVSESKLRVWSVNIENGSLNPIIGSPFHTSEKPYKVIAQ